jgi:hypothetical protein
MPEHTSCPKYKSHVLIHIWKYYTTIFPKLFILFLPISLFVFPEIVSGSDSPFEAPPGYEYSHGDEFSGDELNQEIWGLGINEKNIQNERVDCVYKLENISVENGLMIFTQKREPKPVLGKSWSKDILFNYSSGGVHTHKDYDLRNNMYLELRCKLPQNNAGYSSFWTVSRKVGDWKPEDLLEIDMFEFIAAPEKTRLWSGLWWHDFRADELHDGIPERSYVKRSEDHFFISQRVYKAHHGHGHHIQGNKVNFYQFFTFGLKVTDDEFFWYLAQDGPAWKSKPYFQFSGGKVANRSYGKVDDYEWEREVPKNLHAQVNLNYAMRNAEWAGGPVKDEQLPSKMYVDYVRFFKLKEN